jgi:hypothetical protein
MAKAKKSDLRAKLLSSPQVGLSAERRHDNAVALEPEFPE